MSVSQSPEDVSRRLKEIHTFIDAQNLDGALVELSAFVRDLAGNKLSPEWEEKFKAQFEGFQRPRNKGRRKKMETMNEVEGKNLELLLTNFIMELESNLPISPAGQEQVAIDVSNIEEEEQVLDSFPEMPAREPIKPAAAEAVASRDIPSVEIGEAAHVPDSTVPTHPDRPVAVDELGRQVMARALAKRIQLVRTQDEKRLGAAEEKEEKSGQDASVLMGPFRVNLYGPWGSGKSTLLNFLRAELQAGKDLTTEGSEEDIADPWIVVWFNAWEHQRIRPPWWSLMDSVYRQARRQLWRKDKWRWAFLTGTEFSWRVLQSWSPFILALFVLVVILLASFWGGLLPFGLGSPTTAEGEKTFLEIFAKQATNISAILALVATVWTGIRGLSRGFMLGSPETAANFQQNRTDPMQRLTTHFEKMISRIKLPVAVFIDDLDRCTAEYIVELLEGVQTIYGDAPLTYVIAADRRWIRTAYQESYKDFTTAISEPGRNLGTLFIDKTFHLTVPVPAIPTEIQQEYYERLIGLRASERQQAVQDARKQASSRLRSLKRESDILEQVDAAADEPILQRALREEAVIRLTAPEVQALTEHALQPFAPLLESNPRAMKRFVNAYGIQRSLVTLAGIDVSQQELALWTIVDMRWPQLAEFLEKNPSKIAYVGAEEAIDESVAARLGDLVDLFSDPDVIRVVTGAAEGVDVQLSDEIIRKCWQMRS